MQLEVGKAKTIMENNLKMVLRSKRCNQSVAIQFGHVFQIVPNLPKLSKIFPNLSTSSKPWKMFQYLNPSKKTMQRLVSLSANKKHALKEVKHASRGCCEEADLPQTMHFDMQFHEIAGAE